MTDSHTLSKVIPSEAKLAPNLTPRFSRKIALKAMESKNRAKLEKQYYSQFLKKLCRDGFSLLGFLLIFKNRSL